MLVRPRECTYAIFAVMVNEDNGFVLLPVHLPTLSILSISIFIYLYLYLSLSILYLSMSVVFVFLSCLSVTFFSYSSSLSYFSALTSVLVRPWECTCAVFAVMADEDNGFVLLPVHQRPSHLICRYYTLTFPWLIAFSVCPRECTPLSLTCLTRM